MPLIATLWSLIRKLPPEVVSVLVDIIRKVAASPDPRTTAQRAFAEAARQKALDEALKKKFG